MLEPRQAISDGKPDGNPGVSAAPAESYELAIFMALIKSAKNQPMRPEGSRNSGFAIAGGIDGRGDMHADRLSYEDATSPEAFGYVYVFTKKDFEPYAEREYRAYSSVKPVLSIRVTAKDLPEGITITD